MSEGKTTDGKGDTIKDDVENKSNKVMFDRDFSECVDDCESEKDPSQDHDSTRSTVSKGIQGQNGQEQENFQTRLDVLS